MINIKKENNGIIFVIDATKSINVPLNSVICIVEDASDIVLFRSVVDYDVIVAARWQNITIDSQSVTKENVIDKFNEIANAVNSGGGGSVGTVNWNDIQGKPSTFSPSRHIHSINEVTNLQETLNKKVDDSAIADMATKTWVGEQGYKKIEYLTQSQYDGLQSKEDETLYVITDAEEIVIPDISDMLTKTEASTTYALQTSLQESLDRISALETQVGNISTQLDNINGEIV